MRVTSRTFDETIRLLADCPSLVRLGVIITSIDLVGCGQLIDMYHWHENEFMAFFVELIEHLPKLIALLVVLPGASHSICVATTKSLEAVYRPQRPCFCVQITSELESKTPPKFPLCHYKVLADDKPPIVGALPFHLLPQEP